MLTVLIALTCQNDELTQAAKKAAETTNYTFKVTLSRTGGGGGGNPQSLEAKVDGDHPFYMKGGKIEAWKKGDKLVTKNQEGSWAEVQPPQKGAEKEKGQKAVQLLRGVKTPHEELAGIDASFQEIKKESENDVSVYSGDLTETAAQSFAGKASKKMTTTGSAKVWVNADGAIVKYEITIRIQGEGNKGPVDQTLTKTVEISEVGKTTLEIPEDVKKLFE